MIIVVLKVDIVSVVAGVVLSKSAHGDVDSCY